MDLRERNGLTCDWLLGLRKSAEILAMVQQTVAKTDERISPKHTHMMCVVYCIVRVAAQNVLRLTAS